MTSNPQPAAPSRHAGPDTASAARAWVTKERRRHFGLMVINLGRFRLIADTLGPGNAADFIAAIRERVSLSLRPGDWVERRGDQGLIVLMRAPQHSERLQQVAQSLLFDLRQPVRLSSEAVETDASIGVSRFPDDGDTLDVLIERAELAAERALQAGGNRCEFYDNRMNARLLQEWQLAARLWAAHESGDFTMVFQPTVDASSRNVCGCEALLRWHDAEHGEQSPADFVPLLERSGLIIPVGHQILLKACRQLQAWGSRYGELDVNVNLAPRQFEHPGLLSSIKEALRESGLPARQLVLEITESQLKDIRQTRQVLEGLREIGVRVYVDDFGIGYSSFSYLKTLPVNGLKLDRLFVRNLPTDRKDCRIVETIIGLARNLGLAVVAEGVETEAQARFLAQAGAQQLQGFLFSKGVPVDEFEQLLSRPSGAAKPAGAQAKTPPTRLR